MTLLVFALLAPQKLSRSGFLFEGKRNGEVFTMGGGGLEQLCQSSVAPPFPTGNVDDICEAWSTGVWKTTNRALISFNGSSQGYQCGIW